MVGGRFLLVSYAGLLPVVPINQAQAQNHKSLEGGESPLHTTTVEGEISLAYAYTCG